MEAITVKEYLGQGEVYASQGKFEEALSYYDKAEKTDPSSYEVYVAKGLAYANMEKLDEAKAQFEKALKLDRSLGAVYYHIGSIAVLQGEISQAFEMYNKAISNGFDDAQLYFSIGLVHEDNEEIELAIRNYTKAIVRDGMRADIRIRKAHLLVNSGQFPEAMQAIDETILSNPDVFDGYHMKFMLHMQLKQYDDCEKVLDTAMDMFPRDPGFVIDKATLLIDQGKINDALAVLTGLEKSDFVDDPARRRIYMERAHIYADREDVKTAIKELENANAVFPDIFDHEVVFLLANCHMNEKEYDKLLEYSRRLIENGEESYFKNMAKYFEPLALKNLGRNDEATAAYKEAITLFRNQSIEAPGYVDSYLLRAMCLKDTEQYEPALELLDFVIGLQPEAAEPRMIKVAVLEAMGRKEEAEAETKAANSLLPEELRKK